MKLHSLLLLILICMAAMSLSVSITGAQGFLLILMVWLAAYLWKNKIDITVDCPYLLPFFAYWFSTILSSFLGSPYAELNGNFAMFWSQFYLFVCIYLIKKERAEIVLICLLFAAAFLAVTACYDVLWRHLPRGYGILKSYMSTANILALAGTAALGLAVSKSRGMYLRSYYFLIFIVIFAGLISTGTRGALLGAFGGVSILLVARYKWLGALASAAIIAISVFVGYHTGIMDRFEELFMTTADINTSHGWRLLLWKKACILIEQYPIFGIGSDAYHTYMMKMMPTAALPLPLSEVHNGYLQQLVSYGIIGLAAFVWFYGSIVYGLIKSIRNNDLAFIGLAVTLVYFAEGITESMFTDSKVMMFYSFFIGAVFAVSKREYRF